VPTLSRLYAKGWESTNPTDPSSHNANAQKKTGAAKSAGPRLVCKESLSRLGNYGISETA
jgi:hypothetical protein